MKLAHKIAIAVLPLIAVDGSSWGDAPQPTGPVPWGTGYQDAVTPVMHRIETLSAAVNMVIVAVVLLVCGLLGWVVWRYNAKANPTPAKWSHHTPLEVAWTLIPVLVLLAIALPSFSLLFYMELSQKADLTVKVTGHQWYWSYEYPDENGIKFDSFFVADSDLKPDQPRLLTADNALVLPVGAVVRIQITSDDVIHSWSIPPFGVKVDAMPGRLNETWVRVDAPGVYYGQCSQLCGTNHGFMPIMIRAVPKEEFHAWSADMWHRIARERLQIIGANQ
jgi:cytochrome c oxidase subunit 2